MRRESGIRLNHHSYFELLHLHSSTAQYQVGEKFYELNAGDLFVIGSALPHRIASCGDQQIRCATLYFEPAAIRAQDAGGEDVQYLMPFLMQGEDFPHVVRAETGIPAQVLELIRRIHSELPADSPRARLAARTYLKMILILLVNHYSEFEGSQLTLTQKQRDLDRLQPLFSFIERNYRREVSVREAADLVNMSKSHFMRFFRQVTGQPFVAHLNHFRVAKAQRLLATTDRTVADIGSEVGFCNQSYFGLMFRRFSHSSPREFRVKLAAESPMDQLSCTKVRTECVPECRKSG